MPMWNQRRTSKEVLLKVAAIVPAYNERERIGAVLEAIKSAKLVDEIVVVSDGSTDGTYELVSGDSGLRAINLTPNRGKGGALTVGAQSTDADVLLFLDADLIGLDGAKVDSMVEPMRAGRADMVVGLFKGGRLSTDFAQVIAPYITGQRALFRETFLSISKLDDVRSGVELAITKYARSHRLRVERVVLAGCTHTMKEEKLGPIKGFVSRVRMYLDIGKVLLDGSAFRK